MDGKNGDDDEDLFQWGSEYYRNDDPKESEEAGEGVAKRAARLLAETVAMGRKFKDFTADEIKEAFEPRANAETYRRRVHQAEAKGFFELTGERRLTRSGRYARVYRVKDNEAKEPVMEGNGSHPPPNITFGEPDLEFGDF